jgi:ribonucleotide reductase beta subunit family protein with ferritin-like domain
MAIFQGEQKFIASISKGEYGFVAKAFRDMDKREWSFDAVKTLHEDKIAFEQLSVKLRMAFIKTLARVTFVDFAQMYRLSGDISSRVISNEVRMLLQKQANEELVHTRSYFFIIESVLDNPRIIEDLVLKSSEMQGVNELIDNMGSIALEDMFPTLSIAQINTLICVCNLFVELITFFTNFIFFANLHVTTKKFTGTLATIKYIVKDEIEHGLNIFLPILKKHCAESGILISSLKSEIETLAQYYIAQELAFSQYVNGDGSDTGISSDTMLNYLNYRMKYILGLIGIESDKFPRADNPFAYLEDILGITSKQRNDSFFSSTVTNYDNISVSPFDIDFTKHFK